MKRIKIKFEYENVLKDRKCFALTPLVYLEKDYYINENKDYSLALAFLFFEVRIIFIIN